MANPSKKKGTAFESAVAEYLRGTFPHVARLPLSGARDPGDLGGVPHFAISCKNCKQMALAEWMDGAERAQGNTAQRHAAVIHKRVRRGIGDAYVTMSLHDWAYLVDEAFG